jgi:hypothetical protein
MPAYMVLRFLSGRLLRGTVRSSEQAFSTEESRFMAIPTQTLSEEQMSSFERDVVVRGVKQANWWAQQVAHSLDSCHTPAAKRDVIAVCLDEVRRWHLSGSATSRKPATTTTIAAWSRLVEDWQRQHRTRG